MIFDLFLIVSLLAGIAKGVHLGVMVGLAFYGPKYDTTEHNPQLVVIGTTLSYLGRVLTAHVLISTDPNGLKICSWPSIPPSNLPCPRVRKTKLPLGLIGGSAFGAALIYLGISLQVPSSYTGLASTNVV
jgi:hypothetical protein